MNMHMRMQHFLPIRLVQFFIQLLYFCLSSYGEQQSYLELISFLLKSCCRIHRLLLCREVRLPKRVSCL